MTELNKLSKFVTVINEIKNKRYDFALKLLSKIKTNSNDKYIENKLYGSIYFKKKEWLKSLTYFNKLLKTDEKDLVILNNTGVALFNLGRLNESLKFFQKISILEDKSVNAFVNLGIIYKNLGFYSKAIENFIKALEIENSNDSVKQNLIDIFNYYIPKKINHNLLEINREIINLNKNYKFESLIELDFIKNFIKNNLNKIKSLNLNYKETQIFRRNKINLNCDRHFKVFNKFKIIPKYCFNCYKIQIDMEDVINLIKLFFIFNNIKLENNNIRKCIVETRENVVGNYKGYIFCTGLDEAKKLLAVISSEINKSGLYIKEIKIKHGCTEYYQEYPEFENINYDSEQKFKYRKEWNEKENLIDNTIEIRKKIDEKIVGPTLNQISLPDILIIRNWIAYAKLINDKSSDEIFKQDVKSNYISDKISNQINLRNK